MLKRKELVEEFAKLGYTKKDANYFIADFTKILINALVNGEEISMHGFGTFYVKDIRSRSSVNVRTQERIVIPGYKAPKFNPGMQLKKAIKEGIVRE